MAENEKDPREEYANWKAPETPVEASDSARTQKIVAERRKQTFSSRLSEYLTGMKPEDPRMVERLATDQEIIRGKYNLPSRKLPPAEFERAMMQMVKSLGVKIKSKSECGKFFEENPFAGAVHFGESKQIGMDMDRTDREAYFRSLGTLEHELVHAIQQSKSASMPIELMEYEAYVAGVNMEYLRANPEAINDALFNFFIGVSVNTHYHLESEKKGARVSPVWDNPEYFLKLDGIDPNTIENIRHRPKK